MIYISGWTVTCQQLLLPGCSSCVMHSKSASHKSHQVKGFIVNVPHLPTCCNVICSLTDKKFYCQQSECLLEQVTWSQLVWSSYLSELLRPLERPSRLTFDLVLGLLTAMKTGATCTNCAVDDLAGAGLRDDVFLWGFCDFISSNMEQKLVAELSSWLWRENLTWRTHRPRLNPYCIREKMCGD